MSYKRALLVVALGAAVYASSELDDRMAMPQVARGVPAALPSALASGMPSAAPPDASLAAVAPAAVAPVVASLPGEVDALPADPELSRRLARLARTWRRNGPASRRAGRGPEMRLALATGAAPVAGAVVVGTVVVGTGVVGTGMAGTGAVGKVAVRPALPGSPVAPSTGSVARPPADPLAGRGGHQDLLRAGLPVAAPSPAPCPSPASCPSPGPSPSPSLARVPAPRPAAMRSLGPVEIGPALAGAAVVGAELPEGRPVRIFSRSRAVDLSQLEDTVRDLARRVERLESRDAEDGTAETSR